MRSIIFRLPGVSTSLTVDEWMSVLKLSNMWNFTKMRKKAIDATESHILNSRPVDVILLARKYHISQWLLDGYAKLASRPESITPEEREHLGLVSFFRLVEMRDRSWKYACDCGMSGGTVYARDQRGSFGFKNAIRSAFEDELMEDGAYVPSVEGTCPDIQSVTRRSIYFFTHVTISYYRS